MTEEDIVLYPAGYMIRVVSWENDGDFYNTKEVNFRLDQADLVAAVVEMLRIFEDNEKFYYLYGDFTPMHGAVTKFFSSNPRFLDRYYENPSHESDDSMSPEDMVSCIMDVMYDFVGASEHCMRVLEKYTVFRFDEPVKAKKITLDKQEIKE